MMARRRRQVSDKERATEVYAHRDDPGEWDDTPLRADEGAQQRGVVVSFRLPAAEFIAMQKAAKESGETLSEFIRNSIGLRLYGRATTNSVQITSGLHSGSLQATFLASALSAGQAENPTPLDTDHVPNFANLVARG